MIGHTEALVGWSLFCFLFALFAHSGNMRKRQKQIQSIGGIFFPLNRKYLHTKVRSTSFNWERSKYTALSIKIGSNLSVSVSTNQK